MHTVLYLLSRWTEGSYKTPVLKRKENHKKKKSANHFKLIHGNFHYGRHEIQILAQQRTKYIKTTREMKKFGNVLDNESPMFTL